MNLFSHASTRCFLPPAQVLLSQCRLIPLTPNFFFQIKVQHFVVNNHLDSGFMFLSVGQLHLDQTLFWTTTDLERKLNAFKEYYNHHRVHASLGGQPPCEFGQKPTQPKALLDDFSWRHHCRGLFQTPIPA
ncbi:MAG TPA: hypothetical protein ENI80_02070 [Acidiferrobacteraceae bacterium]|nr:hypothetical protein [Acidiferrobacteraceae bacterium]